MKIRTKGKVYIQRYDAEFILKIAEEGSFNVPECVVNEIKNEGNVQAMTRNSDYPDYEFLVFKEPLSRFWIITQSFIVDYDSYNKLSFEELYHLSEVKEEEANRIWWVYEDLVDEQKNEGLYDGFTNQHILMWHHEVPSINRLANTRKQGIEFPFPEDYKGAQ